MLGILGSRNRNRTRQRSMWTPRARAINVKFNTSADNGVTGPSIDTGSFWNKVTSYPWNLMNSVNEPTAVSFTVSGLDAGYFSGGDGDPLGPILNFYWYAAYHAMTFVFSGLTARNYDVYGIQSCHDYSSYGAVFSIAGFLDQKSGGVYNGSSWVEGQNFAKFSSVIPTGGLITVTAVALPTQADECEVMGFQLSPSFP